MDYCFPGDRPEEDALDDETEEKKKGNLPILVIYDDAKSAFLTLLFSHKGPTKPALLPISLQRPVFWSNPPRAPLALDVREAAARARLLAFACLLV